LLSIDNLGGLDKVNYDEVQKFFIDIASSEFKILFSSSYFKIISTNTE